VAFAWSLGLGFGLGIGGSDVHGAIRQVRRRVGLGVAPDDCKHPFPPDFKWSAAIAAYQAEGGSSDAGRQPSIWDDFCKRAVRCNGLQTLDPPPGQECEPIECADKADDVFHKYKEDITLMQSMHLTAFRMSLSWSRLMSWDPDRKRMVRNPEGVAFYKDLLLELRSKFIEPHVTLYHWDMPLALEQNIGAPGQGGWLSRDIVGHFNDFASLAFEEFGHIVPIWFTVNEPWTFSVFGYGFGMHAPGHKGSPTETYLVGHHVLLAHAVAVQTYRTMRANGTRVRKDGQISFVLLSDFGIPVLAGDPDDEAAAKDYNSFMLDWFLHPVTYGTYPQVMVEKAGDHLPSFTDEEAALVRGSVDGFFGLNHYTTKAVTDCASPRSKFPCPDLPAGWMADVHVDMMQHPKGARVPSNPMCSVFQGYPEGYDVLLNYVHKNYPKLRMMLTENGWCGSDLLDDQDQLWYYQEYLGRVQDAVSRGIPIMGYTAWSLMDNYEWGSYQPRFGLWQVDYENLRRVPKTAALWYSKVAQRNCLDV